MKRKKREKEEGEKDRGWGMEIKRGLEVGVCGGKEGRRGEEKRSEEEENTWIYLKTRLYTRVRPIQKADASKIRRNKITTKKDRKIKWLEETGCWRNREEKKGRYPRVTAQETKQREKQTNVSG